VDGKEKVIIMTMRKAVILFTLVYIFLAFPCVKPAGAQDLYLGRRWGFSQLTATPVFQIFWSADGRFLFFALAGDEASYIYRIKDVWKITRGKTLPGDIRVEKVMELKGKIQDISFSPDRMFAAYSVPEGGEMAGLYVANLATATTKRITQGKGARWAPQGNKILYYFMGRKNLFGIALINPDGTGNQILTELGDWAPVWSTDGSTFAFMSSRDFARGTKDLSNIYTIRLNPAATTQITHEKNSYQKNLSWEPKGRKLIYESYQGIEIVDTGTLRKKLVISRSDYFTSHVFQPVFSPDGRWISFRKEKGMGLYQLYTQEEVTVEGSIVWDSIAMSPDGRKFAFSVEKGVKKGLWVVEAMGN
jgi:Tol biopolymer transport system component